MNSEQVTPIEPVDRKARIASGVSQAGRLAFIDPLRCVAFLSVFIQHVFLEEISRLAQATNPTVAHVFSAIYRFVRIDGAPGVFGVVLFFVISGYCIAKAAERETAGEFAIRRTFRIYPLLIIALALEVALIRAQNGTLPGLREFFGSVTLLGDFLNVPPRLSGVEWTLRLELLFYATVGLGLVFATRMSLPGLGRSTSLAYGAILVVIALSVLLPPFPVEYFSRGYVNLFAPFFVIGAVFVAYERGRIAGMSLVLIILGAYGVSIWTQQAFRPEYGRFAGYYLVAVALFSGGWLLRDHMTGSRPVYLLSMLTYATYLFHKFLVPAIDQALGRLLPSGSELMLGTISPNKLGAIILFFVTMAALVAYIEQPLIRLSKRLV